MHLVRILSIEEMRFCDSVEIFLHWDDVLLTGARSWFNKGFLINVIL